MGMFRTQREYDVFAILSAAALLALSLWLPRPRDACSSFSIKVSTVLEVEFYVVPTPCEGILQFPIFSTRIFPFSVCASARDRALRAGSHFSNFWISPDFSSILVFASGIVLHPVDFRVDICLARIFFSSFLDRIFQSSGE